MSAFQQPEALAQNVARPGVDALMRMPGQSFSGPLAPATAEEQKLAAVLRADVTRLTSLGERSVTRYTQLVAAAAALEQSLTDMGYKVERQEYEVRGRACANLVVEIAGGARAKEIALVGAHYDSSAGTPGANDNGSGVAALLALARFCVPLKPERTLRFVCFTNEEQPHFQTDTMGSMVYARRCFERKETVAGMLCLETLGYYSDAPGSQHYPAELASYYPTTGNFLAFVGDVRSGPLVVSAVTSFRRGAPFPSEGAALPAHLPGVGWSDHSSFWRYGIPAVMATDTAFYRYPYYHQAADTPEKIDFEKLARVVRGLEQVVADLASPPAGGEAAALAPLALPAGAAANSQTSGVTENRGRGRFFRRR